MILNPKAGRARTFMDQLNGLNSVFAKHNFAVELFQTTAAPGSARELAHAAAAVCDLVVACGGDGTVHGVLQGVANTPACLGVLPFGTANALARNLGLPAHPVAALEKLLHFSAREIPLGLAETEGESRWFTVMAGAGPDGRRIHERKGAAKSQVGRTAYYAEAARLFLSRSFPAFRIDYRPVGSQQWKTLDAVAMMASRIPNLGGLFGGCTPDSRLHHPHLLVQLLAAPAHLSLPAWIAIGESRLRIPNPWLTTVEVEELRCSALKSGAETFAQVDGECMGSIPLSIQIQPGGLRLLMPGWEAQNP